MTSEKYEVNEWEKLRLYLLTLRSIKISLPYTWLFIMHSGITKIYYRKTAGHVFTEPVQIEGATSQRKQCVFIRNTELYIITYLTYNKKRRLSGLVTP